MRCFKLPGRIGTNTNDFSSYSYEHTLEKEPEFLFIHREKNTSVEKIYKDYYAFGQKMPGRCATSGNRFGYQGSEKDDEIAGVTGSHYTTFFRELDTRIGRWWAIDPKTSATPWESPYASMGNNPIWYNDILGDVAGNDDPVKKGDTFKGDDGKTYSASTNEAKATATRSPLDKVIGALNTFGAGVRKVDNAVTGSSKMNIGITISCPTCLSEDYKSSFDPAKASNNAKLLNISFGDWDLGGILSLKNSYGGSYGGKNKSSLATDKKGVDRGNMNPNNRETFSDSRLSLSSEDWSMPDQKPQIMVPNYQSVTGSSPINVDSATNNTKQGDTIFYWSNGTVVVRARQNATINAIFNFRTTK